MIEREAFVRGLVRLAIATGRDLDDAAVEVFYEAIGPQTDEAEWERLTRASVASGRWHFFPRVAELVDALNELHGLALPEVEAGDAYERVLEASNYTPEGGASWNFRDVRERCGVAAAAAFLAAGGDPAFRTTWDEARRRERFLRAYISAVRADPSTRLLPAGPTRALPSGEARGDHYIPTDEARGVLQQLAAVVPAAERVRAAPRAPLSAEEWAARTAVLRRQADELLKDLGS